jgi:polyisoprenoid-binding protein YceI
VTQAIQTELPAAGTWALDPSHTEVAFVARHLMVTKVRGRFLRFDGTIQVAEEPEQSSVDVRLDASSITTGADDRDAHLRSPDFLDVETYPEVRFVSTGIERSGNGWRLAGDLTIRDVTKPVVLDMTFDGVAGDPWGGTRAAFTASTEIEREDWGLTWNVAVESGGWLVSKIVKIELDAQAVLQG